MKTYQTREPAKWGVYLAVNRFDLRTVNAEGEVLDGPERTRYVRLPTLLVVAMSPVLGGLFVLFFPVLIVAALVTVGAEVALRAGQRAWTRRAHLRRLRWEPMVAHLDPHDEVGEAKDSPEPAGLRDLEAEVRERRQQENGKPGDTH